MVEVTNFLGLFRKRPRQSLVSDSRIERTKTHRNNTGSHRFHQHSESHSALLRADCHREVQRVALTGMRTIPAMEESRNAGFPKLRPTIQTDSRLSVRIIQFTPAAHGICSRG